MNTQNELIPYEATHPGSVLADELKERKIKQVNFSEQLGISKTVLNEILKGKRNISADLALKLEELLGIDATFWVTMQANYELDTARIKQRETTMLQQKEVWAIVSKYISIPDLKRIGILSGDLLNDYIKIKEIFNFRNIEELTSDYVSKRFALYKKSEKLKISEVNLYSWNKLAHYNTRQIQTKKFNKSCEDDLIKEIKSILNSESIELELIKNCLNSYGIKFLIQEKFEQTPVDGLSFWDNDGPAIVMTMRHKKIDNFIFTLMHELGHIFLHLEPNSTTEFIDLEDNLIENKEEFEANEYAKNKLIPAESWQAFMKKSKILFNDYSFIEFATEHKVHPAVVLGRYQFETKTYNLKTKINRQIAESPV